MVGALAAWMGALGASLADRGAGADAEEWQVRRSATDPRLVERYREALRARPHDGPALRALIGLARQRGGVERLERDVMTAAELPGATPTERRAELVVGARLALARGDEATAAERFERALATGQEDGLASLALARLDRRLGHPERAATLFAGLAARLGCGPARLAPGVAKEQSPPGDGVAPGLAGRGDRTAGARSVCLEALRGVADVALGSGDGETARLALSALVGLSPSETGTRRELAALLERQGRGGEALAQWRGLVPLLRARPDEQARAWQEQARLEESSGDAAEAHEALRRGLLVAPPAMRAALSSTHLAFHRRHSSLPSLVAELPVPRRAADWVERARLHDELGEPEEAARACRRGLALEPRSVEARRLLVVLLDRAGQGDVALDEERRLVSLAPDDKRLALDLADRLTRRGTAGRGEALETLRRLGARRRADVELHRALADRFDRLADSAAARRERELLVRIDPDAPEAWIELGEEQLRQGDRAAARVTWRRLLGPRDGVGRPDRAARLGRLADVLIEHADGASGADGAERAPTLGPEAADEGAALYREALAVAPHDQALRRAAALAFERSGHGDDAAREWSRLVEETKDPRARALRVEAGRRLRLLLAKDGTADEQLAPLRARFEGPPAEPFWGVILAEALVERQRSDDAEAVFAKVIALDASGADRVDALLGRARLERARHDLPRAIATLREAATIDERRAPKLLGEVADLALELGHEDEALAAVQSAVALAPRDASVQARLAELDERRGRDGDALAAWRRVLELAPSEWHARLAAARLLVRRGDAAGAAEEYRRVALGAVEDELALDAARRAIDLAEYTGTLDAAEAAFAEAAAAPGGSARDRARLRRVVVEAIERRSSSLAVRAWRGVGDAPNALALLGRRSLRPLTEALVEGDATEMVVAARVLGVVGNPAAAAPLLKLAQRRPAPAGATAPSAVGQGEPSIDARAQAAEAGAKLAQASSLADLIALASDPERRLRVAAFAGLGRLGDAASSAALWRVAVDEAGRVDACRALNAAGVEGEGRPLAADVAAFRDSDSPETRAECARSLGASPSRAQELATIATGDPEASVRAGAATALGRVADPAAAGALVKLVFTDRDEVRRAALRAVCAHRRPTEVHAAPPAGDVEPSRPCEALDAAPEGAGLTAAVAAGLGGARDLALRTLDDLDARGHEAVRRAVTGAVLQLARGDGGGRDSAVRAAAVRLLARLPPSVSQKTLRAAFGDAAPEVKRAAADAAGLAGDGALRPDLERLRSDSSASVRWAAERAVSRLVRP